MYSIILQTDVELDFILSEQHQVNNITWKLENGNYLGSVMNLPITKLNRILVSLGNHIVIYNIFYEGKQIDYYTRSENSEVEF